MACGKRIYFKWAACFGVALSLVLVFQNCAETINSEALSSDELLDFSDDGLRQALRPSVEALPAGDVIKKSIRNFNLTFQRSTGALLKIEHSSAGIVLETIEGDEGLFSIATPVASYLPLSLETANSPISQEIVEDVLADGRRRLRLVWQILRAPADRKSTGLDQVSIGVVVEITESPQPAEGLSFRLHLQNRTLQAESSKVTVAQVLFPDFRGFRRMRTVGQSIPPVEKFAVKAFDRITNPFLSPPEDRDRAIFYPMATWERVLLPTVATDGDGFALVNDHGVHKSRIFDYNRHYLALLTCPGNGVYITEEPASEYGVFRAEELMYSRDSSGPEGLRVAFRRPLNLEEQASLASTESWWYTPQVNLTVSMNGVVCQ